jgi:pyruvate/2-oxoglutarate/acetoin dehydrogenase E1 component
MALMSLSEAACRSVAEEMRRDPTVWVVGEDVEMGGIFAQYKGLHAEFGSARIVNTPISESTIMGAGLGAALVGTRPIIEMRIADFAMPAMDELVNQISKIRYMFGGQARARVVVRMPHGLLRASAAQHSQIVENWFVNLPGVIVVTPATAADTAGLLKTAIRSDDPVLFFDPKGLAHAKSEVPDAIKPIPFGQARVMREGRDVTLVTWSQTVPASAEAADMAARSGMSVHALDLRTLWPWDEDAVAASLERTGRLVVVHEGVAAGGFGGEVITRMIERLGVRHLKAVKRIGSPRMPVPFAPNLEDAMRITPTQIHAAIMETVKDRGA